MWGSTYMGEWWKIPQCCFFVIIFRLHNPNLSEHLFMWGLNNLRWCFWAFTMPVNSSSLWQILQGQTLQNQQNPGNVKSCSHFPTTIFCRAAILPNFLPALPIPPAQLYLLHRFPSKSPSSWGSLRWLCRTLCQARPYFPTVAKSPPAIPQPPPYPLNSPQFGTSQSSREPWHRPIFTGSPLAGAGWQRGWWWGSGSHGGRRDRGGWRRWGAPGWSRDHWSTAGMAGWESWAWKAEKMNYTPRAISSSSHTMSHSLSQGCSPIAWVTNARKCHTQAEEWETVDASMASQLWLCPDRGMHQCSPKWLMHQWSISTIVFSCKTLSLIINFPPLS